MLTGKVALVTGASRGIGRQIALTLAEYGADVIVNYNGSREKAEEVVQEIESMGRKAAAVQCTVADFEACGKMVENMIAQFGHIDILVNNAGITKDNLMIKMSEADFDAVIETNLKGTFHMIKHMYRPFLKQKAGRIINLSSVTGILGNAGQANYAASKAGKRTGRQKYYGQRGRARLYRYRYDAGDDGYRQRGCSVTDSLKKSGNAERYCRGGSFSGKRKGVLYYGTGSFRGRRHGNLEAKQWTL